MPVARLEQRLLLALATLWLALALLYNVVIPPRMGPDEGRHIAYVKRLVDQQALPALGPGGEELGDATVNHPPLYYLLLTPVYVAFRGLGEPAAWRAMRCCSAPLIGLALALFYLTMLRLWPERRALRLGVLAATALLPHVLMEAAIVNNDVLTILCASALVWQLARLQDRWPTDRQALAFGLTFAAFLNAKGFAVPLVPAWLVWMAMIPRGDRSRREWWRTLALGYLPVLVLGTPWYLRNLALYHFIFPPMPGNWAAINPETGQPIPAGAVLLGLITLLPGPYFLIYRGMFGLFVTFWCQEGWIPPPLGWKVLDILLVVSLAALAGAFKLIVAARRAGRRWWQAWPPAVRLASGMSLALYLNVLAVAVFIHIGWSQGGRYLLPGLVGIMLPFGLGLEALATSRRARGLLFGALAGYMLLLNLFSLRTLLCVLNPQFAPTWRPFGG